MLLACGNGHKAKEINFNWNIGLPSDERACMVFYLSEPSRDNVLREINKLGANANVYSAKVNRIDSVGLKGSN